MFNLFYFFQVSLFKQKAITITYMTLKGHGEEIQRCHVNVVFLKEKQQVYKLAPAF